MVKGRSLIILFLELLCMTTLSQEDLIKQALNHQDPWYIKTIDFSNVERVVWRTFREYVSNLNNMRITKLNRGCGLCPT